MTEKILDMHAHLEYGLRELEVRRSQDTAAFFSCGNPQEWELVREVINGSDGFYLSFGIHPWYSDRYADSLCGDTLLRFYESSPVIGEIGMDSVWCDIPLDIQRNVFCAQLEIAKALHKPVILHTKGQEKEIAEILQGFPEKICIHWYSGDVETLEKLIQMGCYFTLGPDVENVFEKKEDDSAQEEKASVGLYGYMLKHIPVNRLFLETDGASAIAWARGEAMLPAEEIPSVLKKNLRCVAEYKGISEWQLQKQMWENLWNFLE